MSSRNLLTAAVFILSLLAAITSTAAAQTALPGGFEISLLPGYTHAPLQGIDSIVGKITKKDGLEIMYEIGRVPAAGGLRLGGDYSNRAAAVPEQNRLWLKEQTIGGRKFSIAYDKDHRLTISTANDKQGVNFSTVAKSEEELADVLLMVLSFGEAKGKEEE
jgi:hypothetical protein